MDVNEKNSDEKEGKKTKLKLKKKVKILLGLLLSVLLIILGILITFSFLTSPVSSVSTTEKFVVPEGSSVYSIGQKLEKEGFIKNYFAYKILVKLSNTSSFKAGIYKIDKSLSTKEIIDLLSGENYKEEGITITFKEGKNIRNIAKTISKNTNITESEFYAKLEDESYIDSLINKYWFLTNDIKNESIYYPLEGYLFPETYVFSTNPTVEEIIGKMLDQEKKVLDKYMDDIKASKYSIHELATLASMAENEGIYSEDRKLIVSVFNNRLNKNMSLGSDVTTYYAFKVDMGERDLTQKEINTYNPYNTRGPKMSGKLPVGPISNFSEDSLKATLYPKESDYYYFVADKSGKTHFSKDYEEHQKIIKELKEAGNWIEW